MHTITETWRKPCTGDIFECFRMMLVFKRYDSATSQWYSNSSNERSGKKYEDWVNSQSEELYLCLTNGIIYRYDWTYSFFCIKWLLEADTNGRIFFMWMPDNKHWCWNSQHVKLLFGISWFILGIMNYVDTCITGAKAMVSKTACAFALAWIKAVNYSWSLYSSLPLICT